MQVQTEVASEVNAVDSRIAAEYTEEETSFVKNNFEMKAVMAEKRKQILQKFTGKTDPNQSAQEEKMRQQQEEYAERGISLTYFSKDDERCVRSCVRVHCCVLDLPDVHPTALTATCVENVFHTHHLTLDRSSATVDVAETQPGHTSSTWTKTCFVQSALCTSWINR